MTFEPMSRSLGQSAAAIIARESTRLRLRRKYSKNAVSRGVSGSSRPFRVALVRVERGDLRVVGFAADQVAARRFPAFGLDAAQAEGAAVCQ